MVGVFETRIVTFGIIFGIKDIATVPHVIAICNRVHGDDGPSIFACVNVFHQLGACLMAFSGSMIWIAFGNYSPLWYASGALCLLASAVVYTNSYRD